MTVAALHGLYLALVPLSLLAGGVGAWAALRSVPSPGLARASRLLGALAAAATLAAWCWRWVVAGHLPLFGTYESALSLALACHVAALLGFRLRPGAPPLARAFSHVAAALVLWHGSRFDRAAWALTISERSWVVDVHAVAAWLAFGALVANAGVSLRWVLPRPPSGERAERTLALTLGWGFFLHTAMMTTGSLYKFLLFGRAWSFDPIETMGLAVWTAYGTLLHLNLLTGGWKGRRLAAWCLFVFALLAFSYRGIVYFPAWSSYHIFDMDLRLHIPG